MARGGDKNGARSSFSVLLGDAPHLDMEYAIFGWVVHILHARPLSRSFQFRCICQAIKTFKLMTKGGKFGLQESGLYSYFCSVMLAHIWV